MKRSIVMGMALLGLGLAATAFAQTATFTPIETKSAALPGILSYFFPCLDPFCIGQGNDPRRKHRARLGEECFSLNFDLVIMKYQFDGRAVPLAKLKFGF